MVCREAAANHLLADERVNSGPHMRLGRLSQILFIIYCIEAGVIFLLAPWGAVWDRFVFQIPSSDLRSILLHPFFRSFISAFGLVHLIWGAHDLDLLLLQWKSRRAKPSL